MISISKEFIYQLVKQNGFKPQSMEKVLRLLGLLNEIFVHPYLKDRFVLKGGTALNLFVFELPRLSVDIDLNYIGSADREVMTEERTLCEQGFQSIFDQLGFQIKRSPSEHAGGKWQLQYTSSFGDRDSLGVDLNYMLRIPLLPIQKKNSIRFGHVLAQNIPILNIHELAAGKLAALFSRTVSRDLFDTYQLAHKANLDQHILKPLFLVYGAINRRDWRTIDLEDLTFDYKEYHQKLIPMLSQPSLQDSRHFDFQKDCLGRVKAFADPILKYSKSEQRFLDLILDKGEIDPSLITTNLTLQEKISAHPGLLWKVKNVRTFKNG